MPELVTEAKNRLLVSSSIVWPLVSLARPGSVAWSFAEHWGRIEQVMDRPRPGLSFGSEAFAPDRRGSGPST